MPDIQNAGVDSLEFSFDVEIGQAMWDQLEEEMETAQMLMKTRKAEHVPDWLNAVVHPVGAYRFLLETPTFSIKLLRGASSANRTSALLPGDARSRKRPVAASRRHSCLTSSAGWAHDWTHRPELRSGGCCSTWLWESSPVLAWFTCGCSGKQMSLISAICCTIVSTTWRRSLPRKGAYANFWTRSGARYTKPLPHAVCLVPVRCGVRKLHSNKAARPFYWLHR